MARNIEGFRAIKAYEDQAVVRSPANTSIDVRLSTQRLKI
jgi:hypothetical protein